MIEKLWRQTSEKQYLKFRSPIANIYKFWDFKLTELCGAMSAIDLYFPPNVSTCDSFRYWRFRKINILPPLGVSGLIF
jgi:hypothetical protein